MPAASNDMKKLNDLLKVIKSQMKEKNVSVYQLQKATGIPKMTLYDTINKRYAARQLLRLVQICHALDLDITIKPKS